MALDYETQENFYKKYWLEIQHLLVSSETIENFIIQYLITKRESADVMDNGKSVKLSAKNLYPKFKDYFEEEYLEGNLESIEEFLKDLYRYAKFYSRVTFRNEENFSQLSALEKKFYELTYLLEAKYTPIVLMYLYDKFDKKFFDEEIFIQFVEACISLTFRARVCRANGITAQFAGNFIKRLKKFDVKYFWLESICYVK